MSIESSMTRKIRGGPNLPASPAFKDVFMKSGSAAGLYVCISAGSWSGPLDSTSDTGDFVGPASSTDNALVRFDGAGGKTGQNSLVTVDDSGSVNIPTGQTYKINNVALPQQAALDLKANLSPAVREITAATGVIDQSDNGKIIRANRATGQTLTITGPFTAGFNCVVIQEDAGQTTFAAGGGAAVINRQTHTKIAGEGGLASLVCYVADSLILGGDTAA